jgi:hypothetical protein
VALFLDGKSFADATLVIALGVTADGTKRARQPLGLARTLICCDSALRVLAPNHPRVNR